MATKDRHRSDEDLAQGLLDEPDFLREVVEKVLGQLLEAEITEHIGAAHYERSESRTGQRNGYKPRTLRIRVGTLKVGCAFRTGRGLSPPNSSPATSETRRRWSWRSWRCR